MGGIIMKTVKWVAAAAVLALAAAAPAVSWAQAASNAQGLGACFWSNVSDQDKSDFATMYHQSLDANHAPQSKAVSDWLLQKSPDLNEVFAKCDANPNIPHLLRYLIQSAQFTEYAAARELAATAQISRDELDQSWNAAPDSVRQCMITAAAGTLAGNNTGCPPADGVSWFMKDLGTRHTLDRTRGDTLMVVTYMNRKALNQVAEIKIAAAEASGTAPAAAAN
jgi:hypothetical protein